jgi:MFS family permease
MTMKIDEAAADESAEKPKSFAALRNKGARAYLLGSALVMMADSMEHVISYWVIFEKFHSPTLGGFAVIAHWVPFLLFSMASGALADRFDPRRIIQIGMVLFIIASLAWGILIFVDGLQQWHAVVILIVHGMAGVFWGPSAQLLIHDIVGSAQLHSAVRLLAMSRTLGLLLGPAIGGAMMLTVGPVLGLVINAAIYLPLTLWLWRAPYGPKFSDEPHVESSALRGFTDIVSTLRSVAINPIILSMTALAGTASLLVGNAFQAQMPAFATALGTGASSFGYSVLLSATAAGAIISGTVLETRSFLPQTPKTAFVLVGLWCISLAGFAATSNFAVAAACMFAAGFLHLAYASLTQTLVQLHAPKKIRGRVIGVYSMASLGLMSFSGVTIGVGGSFVGVHLSLGASAITLLVVVLALSVFVLRSKRVEYAAGE